MRFQLEMKRLELEAEERSEARKIEAEERRIAVEARRLELESEERRETRMLELEVRRLEVEKHRDFFERQMVRSMQLIPDFDEQKIAEWFRRFEKKAAEFG